MNRFVPADLISVPSDINSVAAVIVVWFQHQTVAPLGDELQQIDLVAVIIALALRDLPRPGNVPAIISRSSAVNSDAYRASVSTANSAFL